MTRSMTGFGRAERRAGTFLVSVEIRSVNHRHAEIRVKVPPPLAALEDPLRQQLGAAVVRGRVDATVNVSGGGAEVPVEVNHTLVAAYLRAAAEVAERHGIEGHVPLERILALPGVISLRAETAELTPAQRAAIEAAFREAIGALQQARASEGRHLAADIVKRLRAVEKHRSAIVRIAKTLPSALARRLRARIAEIGEGRAVDPGRLAQEAAMLASRADITEELVRLQGHVEQAIGLLGATKEPAGKKLDFLLQEMHREANTINSKSEDLRISREALAIKAEIEKVREQAQNIE